MLMRPHKDDKAERRRTQKRERNASHRRRQDEGRMCVQLVLGVEHINLLCANRWLPQERDTFTRQQIKTALQAMLDDAAAHR